MASLTDPGRRRLLAAGAAWLAAPKLALAARPMPRPDPRPEGLAAIFAASGLGPLTGAMLADAATGEILDQHRPDVGAPPASVAKIVTALYALESLGPGYRFATRLLGRGPLEAGVLRGDLVLAGGGDPLLDTDALGALAQALGAEGLTRVDGRFLVTTGALPAVARIAPGQPDDAGYNPPVSGLNLNFNRVFLAWSPGAAGPSLRFTAPGETFDAPVASVTGELVARGPARLSVHGGREVWSLPRGGVAATGSMWLPVRAPAAYAGEVFRALARQQGIALPPAEVRTAAPGAVLALRHGPPLDTLLRDMLKYSTNLTAEAVGLRASQGRGLSPEGLAPSAAAMTAWARERFGLAASGFVNHSGLSDRNRTTAADMTALLLQAQDGLPALLKPRPLLTADRQPLASDAALVAKTGTMDFISGLAGYLDTPRRRLAFAIFAANPARRAAIRPSDRDDPPGAASWAARARAQEQALLRRWVAAYA
jgi:D-alanyl-D-alanine carboxypeptidase/D-alanyl-D-alanine-endopeptidase (penicillin-binding protein 4)